MSISDCLNRVKDVAPLIHSITNYVTMHDVANVILACGGKPIMSSDIHEVEDVTSICNGLNLNVGTLNSNSIEAMVLAGRKSNSLNHPVVLDMVGMGSSRYRTNTVMNLIDAIKFSVVKGNLSEVKAMALGTMNTSGVDANRKDAITPESLDYYVTVIERLATRLNTIVVVTGAIDLVSNGKECYVVRNGTEAMGRVTGIGCQLSGVISSYISANLENQLQATASAVALMGLAGEVAWSNMLPTDGNATYGNRIIDAIYNIDGDTLREGANYDVR